MAAGSPSVQREEGTVSVSQDSWDMKWGVDLKSKDLCSCPGSAPWRWVGALGQGSVSEAQSRVVPASWTWRDGLGRQSPAPRGALCIIVAQQWQVLSQAEQCLRAAATGIVPCSPKSLCPSPL